MLSADLFDSGQHRPHQQIADGAILLRGFARDIDHQLLEAVDQVLNQAALRHMVTPGGYRMSVAMTNCGNVGWVTDRKGYRYQAIDPQTGLTWPAMPQVFMELATNAANHAGYADFLPDACLINCYEPSARMSLHQDKNEQDAAAPIVSVSLGLPAVFLFGGLQRSDKPQCLLLEHGDVVVWGGPARFNYHGIAPLKDGLHSTVGRKRINLTFRKAR
ncbi:MAG TPA: DNA oxidative demethylase AlkB [Methylophilaceae bacterium]|nr:DNA oxidative demethylase AlkB [Methylophilaceae bacterium]